MRQDPVRRRAGVVARVVALLALASPAGAQTLTLAAALDSAAAHHPSVAISAADAAAARAAVGEAGAARYPSLHFNGSATQYQEPSLVTPIHGFRPNLLPAFDTTIFQGTLGANWLLVDGGGRGARIDAARFAAADAEAAFVGSQQELATRVVDSYLRVLTGQQVQDAQDQRLAALDAEVTRAHQRQDAGRAAQVEVLRAEAERASAAADRVRFAAVLDVGERDLARWLGTTPEATRAARLVPVALADTTLPERAATIDTAHAANPLLHRAAARAHEANANARLARSARWPELKAVGNYVGWADDEGDDALEWNAGLQVGVPIFTGGAISKGIEHANASRRAADESLRLARLDVESDVDQAVSRLVQARARVRSLTTAVERFSEVARIEKLALGAGSGTQTDYLEAEADLLQARAGLAEARNGETIARVDVARASGTLDRAWIARTLENRP